MANFDDTIYNENINDKVNTITKENHEKAN